jgi:hypothetical protein
VERTKQTFAIALKCTEKLVLTAAIITYAYGRGCAKTPYAN